MKVTYRNIIARLNLYFPQYEWDAMESRVKGLVAEATRKSSTYQHKITVGREQLIPVLIEDGVGKLPEDCMKCLVAYNEESQEIDWHQESDFIKPAKIHNGYIYIAYHALPLDEEGMPVIMEQQYDYCYYHTLVAVMREDYFNGKLNGNMWMELVAEHDASFRLATATKLSTRAKDKLVRLGKQARYFNENPKRF